MKRAARPRRRTRLIELPDNSVLVTSRAAWRRWLTRHHTRPNGLWLVTYKKSTNKPRIEYDETVEEALCFGWIDSKTQTLDDERTMMWCAPRRPRTAWARSNKLRIERLFAADRMVAAGLAKVEAAKQDGSWNALDDVEALVIPPDLHRALGARKNARKHFDAFPPSVKRGLLDWIRTAKKSETRSRRIDETARLAARNIRANEWSPKKP